MSLKVKVEESDNYDSPCSSCIVSYGRVLKGITADLPHSTTLLRHDRKTFNSTYRIHWLLAIT